MHASVSLVTHSALACKAMKAHIFLQGKPGEADTLLAEVQNLEVIPRGLYVIDDEVYEYTGQPTFIIEKLPYVHGPGHALKRVEITVKKPSKDHLG
jgi:hypothetical protein